MTGRDATTRRTWWHDGVVYQIYPRSFADSDGDGIGDLRGIIERLDYIADLGVDAVWLSPIFVSPMKDFGYDVADHCHIDPLFGTDADLDDLLAGLHERGLRLLLDWVPNHTSDQHPWFVESRSSRASAKRDWYVWRDPRPDGAVPSNWMSTFRGVPAWTFDEATGQYWFHLFLPEQPDLNWANPQVEAAMHDTLRHWLDRGVDGFRADVVHLIGKGDDVDDLPEKLARLAILAVDRPLAHELLRRIRTLLDSYEHAPMMVGEVYLLAPGQTVTYLGTDEAPELHLTFDFRPVHTEWGASSLGAALAAVQADFADPYWPTWVLSNHDQPRHRTRFGSEARARAAAVLSLTVRGTPFLYAGEELGLEDAVVPDELATDPDGRDPTRAPIPWEAAGGERSGHGWPSTTWLPFPANAATHAADAQVGVAGSMHDLYRHLLRLRREHPVLHRGAMTAPVMDGELLRYTRTLDDARVDVAINMGDEPVTWPADLAGPLVVASEVSRTAAGGTIAGCEAVVVGDLGSPR